MVARGSWGGDGEEIQNAEVGNTGKYRMVGWEIQVRWGGLNQKPLMRLGANCLLIITKDACNTEGFRVFLAIAAIS